MLLLAGIFSLSTSFSVAATSNLTPNSYTRGVAITFQQNAGQAPSQVQFIAREKAYNLFLNHNETVLQFFPTSSRNGAVLKTSLLGSNQDSVMSGEEKQPGIVNYLNPKDPAKNITGVPTFARVRYASVYNGIDLVYYGGARKLEYDFEVAPGADPSKIQMEISGAESLATDADGNLIIKVGNRKIAWLKPAAYQQFGESKRKVGSSYTLLNHNRVAFKLADYDRTKTLIIDPTLVYSTYLGGSFGTTSEDTDPHGGADAFGAAAVDSSGNAYLLGVTTSFDYPTTPGAYSETAHSGCDPNGGCPHGTVVTKLSSGSGSLVYSTYIEFFVSDFASGGIAVDSNNRAFIAFSRKDTLAGDCFCAAGEVDVLNATGSALDYEFFLGDGINDTYFKDIAVGASGIAYVVGKSNSPSLPSTSNAFQPALSGGFDAIVAKLDTTKTGNDSILYLSYLGGTQDDQGTGVATSGGQMYVSGSTSSANFPVSSTALQKTFGGGATDGDAFAAKFNTNAAGASSLVYSTYLGGNGDDAAKSVTLDASGNSYLTGYTRSTNFPTSAGVYSRSLNASGLPDMFVTKINASGSGLVFSTYVGGEDREVGERIRIDGNGSVFVVGNTDSAHFPTTSDALRGTAPGGPGSSDQTNCKTFSQSQFMNDCDYKDGILFRLNSTGSTLLYSSYIGGSQNEAAYGLALTPSPSAVVAGGTASSNFPVSSNAIQKTLRGPTDGFVMKLSFPATSTTTCSTPSTARTIHICSPANSSTVSSPVQISATAKPGSSAIKVMQVYVDGVKKYEKTSTSTISTSLSMSTGTHRVTVQAQDSAGYFHSTVNITVH